MTAEGEGEGDVSIRIEAVSPRPWRISEGSFAVFRRPHAPRGGRLLRSKRLRKKAGVAPILGARSRYAPFFDEVA